MPEELTMLERLTLVLLRQTAFQEGGDLRCWKGYDWQVMNRLHEKGLISDPVRKAKSVFLTDEGRRQAEALAAEYLGASNAPRSAEGPLCVWPMWRAKLGRRVQARARSEAAGSSRVACGWSPHIARTSRCRRSVCRWPVNHRGADTPASCSVRRKGVAVQQGDEADEAWSTSELRSLSPVLG